MSANGADPALVREVLRDVLAELLPDLVGAVPVFPPPPVAAVHRPSGWHGAPQASTPAEEVSISNDAELEAFVHRLLARSENPGDRAAIRSGQIRFTLRGSGSTGATGTTVRRIDRGAVSERVVREAAAARCNLVLGPKAVLTPMARDVARSLGVTIEKEKRC
jgi:hypothetical protein